MDTLEWIKNEDHCNNPEIKVGDTVQLKLFDVFRYCVLATVVSVEKQVFVATVEKVFDWDNGGELKASNTLNLIGKKLSLNCEFIHEVK